MTQYINLLALPFGREWHFCQSIWKNFKTFHISWLFWRNCCVSSAEEICTFIHLLILNVTYSIRLKVQESAIVTEQIQPKRDVFPSHTADWRSPNSQWLPLFKLKRLVHASVYGASFIPQGNHGPLKRIQNIQGNPSVSKNIWTHQSTEAWAESRSWLRWAFHRKHHWTVITSILAWCSFCLFIFHHLQIGI